MLEDRVIVITGASRGIGLATALAAAQKGAHIAILAKTTEPHPTLEGTIYTAAEAIESCGVQALPIATDIRDESQVEQAISKVVDHFGRIDGLINNASAIFFAPIEHTEMKRYDLAFDINARGSFCCAKYCLPHLSRSDNGHILNDSPPLHADLATMWGLDGAHFVNKVAYLSSKMVMSLWTLGMSQECRSQGVAVNSIWPQTPIATAAITHHMPELLPLCRQPQIMADASVEILQYNAKEVTGEFLIDEAVLRQAGVEDFSRYAVSSSPSNDHAA